MSPKNIIAGILVISGVLLLALGISKIRRGSSQVANPTPTPPVIEQLSVQDQPQVSLTFSKDNHFVSIDITNIKAASLEYNLIYDAMVKGVSQNTGVSASPKLEGQTSYSYKQLLGSESSGKFTYHENITNATFELTLRNDAGYSIYKAEYPFTVSPGKTISLTASE